MVDHLFVIGFSNFDLSGMFVYVNAEGQRRNYDHEMAHKKVIEECNDMELLDLVYRILVFDITEGRAD